MLPKPRLWEGYEAKAWSDGWTAQFSQIGLPWSEARVYTRTWPAASFTATIPAWWARTSAIAATTSAGARLRASRTKDSLDSSERRTSNVTCRLGTAEADATSSRVHFHARAARASHRGASDPRERGAPADRTLSRPRPSRTVRDAGLAPFGGRPRMRAIGVQLQLCNCRARFSVTAANPKSRNAHVAAVPTLGGYTGAPRRMASILT